MIFNINSNDILNQINKNRYNKFVANSIFISGAYDFLKYIEKLSYLPSKDLVISYLNYTHPEFSYCYSDSDIDETLKYFQPNLKKYFFDRQKFLMELFITTIFDDISITDVGHWIPQKVFNDKILTGIIEVLNGEKPYSHIAVLGVLQRENYKEFHDNYSLYSSREYTKPNEELLKFISSKLITEYNGFISYEYKYNKFNQNTVLDILKLFIDPVVEVHRDKNFKVIKTDESVFNFIKTTPYDNCVCIPIEHITCERIFLTHDIVNLWALTDGFKLRQNKLKEYKLMEFILNMILLHLMERNKKPEPINSETVETP
jgi:hypothetical protein